MLLFVKQQCFKFWSHLTINFKRDVHISVFSLLFYILLFRKYLSVCLSVCLVSPRYTCTCKILKILLLVNKSLNVKAPSYLSDLLTYRRSSYSLRSVNNGDLVEPSSKMRTYGDRSFAVCTLRFWNSLPLSIRRGSSVDIFKNVLKTYLFKMFISECL